jgi:murein DD-endopeptidase MepM/ murein hydrolase activator NlpD
VHLEDDLKNYFGINPYVFVNNNPIRNRDADGNIPHTETVSVLAIDWQNYGVRYRDVNGYPVDKNTPGAIKSWHPADDLAIPKDNLNVDVKAGAEGVVAFAGEAGDAGYMVKIQHERGYDTSYKHLQADSTIVKEGQRVMNGEVLAKVGSTGRSTGPHLDYQINKNGKDISPYMDLQVQIDIEKKTDIINALNPQIPNANIN